MGLFGRRDRRGSPIEWLIVGLGNPGEQYARTRHNVGAECVELLAERCDAKLRAGKDSALTAEVLLGSEHARSVLAFPLTYMNESGRSVSGLVRRYGIEHPERIVVVHDELDLEPGVLRLKSGGGLAGNNGLRSIAQHLKTQDFLRVRIGIGKPPNKERGASHVLTRVPKRQRELLDVAIAEAADAVVDIVDDGIEAAMNTWHTRS